MPTCLHPRKRAISDEFRAAREARALLEPAINILGPWQAEAARLAMSAQRMRAAGRHDPVVVEAIAALLAAVVQQEARLEAQLRDGFAQLRGHSRVSDTQQALRALARRLQDAQGADRR